MPEPRLRIDGQAQTFVAADDRGLAYGDGVFRTLAIDNGQVVARVFQYERLAHDCAALDIQGPSAAWLDAELGQLIEAGDTGVAKITVTRGSGGRGYTPPVPARPRVIIAFIPGMPTPPDTLALDIAATRLACQPLFAGVKHLNRLEQVWARREAGASAAPDLAMTDTQGRLVATTMRNLLFMDPAGLWYTPGLARCGIAGATRARLMQAAEQAGRPVVEVDIHAASIADFCAAIACNSIGGAIAVSRIGENRFEHSPAMARRAAAWLAATA